MNHRHLFANPFLFLYHEVILTPYSQSFQTVQRDALDIDGTVGVDL